MTDIVEAMPGEFLSEQAGRHRSILVNQTLLSAAALLAIASSVLLGIVADASLFVAGASLVFLGVVLAILAPWDRLPAWAVGVVPIIDVVAVTLLRESAPTAGMGLLWAFPAMWIGAVFGAIGVIAVSGAVLAIVVAQVVAEGAPAPVASTFVLPFTIVALSTISHLSSRRSRAQRQLLEKQSKELRRSVDRARAEQDLVTEVLDAVDFGVIRITPTGDLAVTNEAHARLQGSTGSRVPPVATFTADGVTPIPADATPLARARAGEVFEGQLVWYGLPGENRRALSVTARPLPDRDGHRGGTVVVSRDVTVEEQALRAREDLVASVSHELRTPLTSIVGYLELALDDPGIPPATRAHLRIAERNATRLRELIADILALSTTSRLGVDLSLSFVQTDVGAIVRAAIESEAPGAAEHGIRIVADEVRRCTAEVDPHRLRQVIDNLLSNAVKYNRRGGTVEVEVSEDEASVILTVRDDGAGISEAERGRLFERFFRADAVRKSAVHGSGLGLAISRDIVRAHGGDITVQSEAGTGSTFTVVIPRQRQDES